MSESTGLIAQEQGEITLTAMLLSNDLSFEEWEDIGGKLQTITKGVMFWVGDWLNFGEHHYGEAYSQAMEKTGYDYKTVKQAKYISNKFPPEVRNEQLTFSHYSVVAGEDSPRAIELLSKAVAEDMTVSELRAERKGEVEQKPTDPVSRGAVRATCPQCQNHFEVPLD